MIPTPKIRNSLHLTEFEELQVHITARMLAAAALSTRGSFSPPDVAGDAVLLTLATRTAIAEQSERAYAAEQRAEQRIADAQQAPTQGPAQGAQFGSSPRPTPSNGVPATPEERAL